jgi:hypothetical protein
VAAAAAGGAAGACPTLLSAPSALPVIRLLRAFNVRTSIGTLLAPAGEGAAPAAGDAQPGGGGGGGGGGAFDAVIDERPGADLLDHLPAVLQPLLPGADVPAAGGAAAAAAAAQQLSVTCSVLTDGALSRVAPTRALHLLLALHSAGAFGRALTYAHRAGAVAPDLAVFNVSHVKPDVAALWVHALLTHAVERALCGRPPLLPPSATLVFLTGNAASATFARILHALEAEMGALPLRPVVRTARTLNVEPAALAAWVAAEAARLQAAVVVEGPPARPPPAGAARRGSAGAGGAARPVSRGV